MRNQTRAPPQPTAPAFEEFVQPAPAQKSASEDLFGLDAFSTSPTNIAPQSTGGSGNIKRSFDDPFGNKAASPTSPKAFQPSQPQRGGPAGNFKPFMPTSAFGQSLGSQNTGGSGSSAALGSRAPQQQPSAMDDLLGDNDPEVSKTLTKDTTDLANMSNQVGQLTNQMKELQTKKATTEADLNSTSTQKRDLELRLSQFRTQYENEVKSVRSLEDRLSTSRNETQKLRQELSQIETQYHDIRNEHSQVAQGLEADQRENASLKERIRQTNAEISSLKPQLEKARMDARQQKGMVSINKKQLATNEGERDKIKSEMSDLARQAQEASAQQSAAASQVASPALSTASRDTNPFFKRSPQPPMDNTMTASAFSPSTSQAQNKFDFFGSSSGTPTLGPPPTTSFRQDPGVGGSVSSGPDVPTPSTSPPLSNYHESPRAGEPPAPPESRQISLRELPIRENVPR
ncbi:hypothetical protein LTS18_012184, partial [Coniosporium uncinatum]